MGFRQGRRRRPFCLRLDLGEEDDELGCGYPQSMKSTRGGGSHWHNGGIIDAAWSIQSLHFFLFGSRF
ncbi:hypothetical protein Scep_025748 [Stephania cephalantha]|uniref:Uncharacterized protein n=1 Tax=Stephania cephalantha TaxID=152367 RepID=A0AAP0EJ96_9MAGN